MIKTDTGSYDAKGHWKPSSPAKLAPVWQGPFDLKALIKFIFGWGGYLWPGNVIRIGLAAATWYFLQPGFDVTAQLQPWWMLAMLGRNIALLWIVAGTYHLFLYTFKLKGKDRKYNPNWQDLSNKKFLFRNQVADNMFWATISGAIIWTGYEVLYVWLAANGRVPILTWEQSPVFFILWFIFIPFWRDNHFYLVHRLLHWKPLFKAAHYIHHKNTNPAPFSGTSMHPIEHIIYWSCTLIHFIVPSHPIHFFFNAQHAALVPYGGHDGFEGPLLKGLLPAGDYMHYLHHKHISCNYGTIIVPWDRCFGSFYNGEGKYPFKIDWAKRKKIKEKRV